MSRSADGDRGPHVAVVLARETLTSLVALVLRHLGLTVVDADTAAEAAALLNADTGLVLIDLMLPGAADVLTSARMHGLPTLALIDLEAGMSSLTAFAAGADQAIRIPFTPDELAVRAGALARRNGRPLGFTHGQRANAMDLSLDEHVGLGGRIVVLDPTQNSLLYLLAARAGVSVTFAEMRRLVWGIERAATDGDVTGLVRGLAGALGRRAGQAAVEVGSSAAILRHVAA